MSRTLLQVRTERLVLPALIPVLTHDEAREALASVSGRLSTPLQWCTFSSIPSLSFSSKGTIVFSNRQRASALYLLGNIHSRLVAIIRVFWVKRAHVKESQHARPFTLYLAQKFNNKSMWQNIDSRRNNQPCSDLNEQ